MLNNTLNLHNYYIMTCETSVYMIVYLQASNNKLPCSLESLLSLSVSPCLFLPEKNISVLEYSKMLLIHTSLP